MVDYASWVFNVYVFIGTLTAFTVFDYSDRSRPAVITAVIAGIFWPLAWLIMAFCYVLVQLFIYFMMNDLDDL